MIRHVEDLEAEFQVALLLDRQQLQHREVPAYEARADDGIAAGVAVSAERFQNVRIAVLRNAADLVSRAAGRWAARSRAEIR